MTQDIQSGPGDLAPGEQLAGYEIQQRIGRGGMAVVYRALDLRLGRLVALKVLAPQLSEDEAFRQRFIRESRAAAGVDHPHIIPVFEAGDAGGVLFIAMRYVSRGDVRSLIEADGRLSPERTTRIAGQVSSALDTAHAHGLVHRDVKPANLLLGQASGSDLDHAYLSDFGLSKHALNLSTLTSTGQFLGTLDYVSPEQIQGQQVDGRADQYALACTVVEMLTGAPPFRRDDSMALMWAQIEAAPPKLTERRPELPPAVDEVIAAAMAKSPNGRYATCGEFAAALAAACQKPSAHPPTMRAGPLPVAPLPVAPLPNAPLTAAPLTAAATSADAGLAGRFPPRAGRADDDSDARQTDPFRAADVAYPEQVRAEAPSAEAARAGTFRSDPRPPGAARADTFRAEAPSAEAARADTFRAEASPAEAARAGTFQAEASPAEAARAGTFQAEARPAEGARADTFGSDPLRPGARTADPFLAGGAADTAASAHPAPSPWTGARRDWYRSAAGDPPLAAEQTAGPGWRTGSDADGRGQAAFAPFRPAVDAAWPAGPSLPKGGGAAPETRPRPHAGGTSGRGQHRARNVVLALAIVVIGLGGVAGIAYKLSHRNYQSSLPPVTVTRTIPASVQDPARTVREYFAAINHRRYLAAWRLSGAGESYATFRAGFAGTLHDTVTILSTQGNVVTARLVATQTNGKVKTYQGTYTVSNGVITATNVHQIS